jgi:hypothetical protein
MSGLAGVFGIAFVWVLRPKLEWLMTGTTEQPPATHTHYPKVSNLEYCWHGARFEKMNAHTIASGV